MPGLRFGRCETLFRIASGGMAEVFAARIAGEAGFSKLVAVKRVLPGLGEDEAFTRMFLEEARVAAQLTSPHIVQTLDVGRADGLPYMVQELVVGVDLLELIIAAKRAGGRIPVAVALELLAQAAIGLHEAHEARTMDGRPLELVHRDVSPHNLLVGADGRVRLADFGVARVAFDRLVATRTGTVKGKLAYLSPEQITGGVIDRRSDLFSLGIVAWETLVGERLFGRDTPTATIDAVRSDPIASLEDRRPDVPPRAAAVIARALDRDVASRLASARVMADELRRAGREARLELSDQSVARYVRELGPPRLRQLEERIRLFTAQPKVETLPDIDLPSPDSIAETAIYEEAATEIEPPTAPRRKATADVETSRLQRRDAGRPPNVALAEAETVRLKDPPAPTVVDLRRYAWEHGHWLVPTLMVCLGVLLAVIAILIVAMR